MRRIVSVEFNPWDHRSYDYLCDLDDVAVGDRVIVETKRGENTVTVTGIKDRSDRATASILRRADEPVAQKETPQ
jgi:hypothetical protein